MVLRNTVIVYYALAIHVGARGRKNLCRFFAGLMMVSTLVRCARRSAMLYSSTRESPYDFAFR